MHPSFTGTWKLIPCSAVYRHIQCIFVFLSNIPPKNDFVRLIRDPDIFGTQTKLGTNQITKFAGDRQTRKQTDFRKFCSPTEQQRKNFPRLKASSR